PRVRPRRANPDPGRADHGSRRGILRPGPRRPERADEGENHSHHHSRPVLDPESPSDSRDPTGQDRGDRNARGTRAQRWVVRLAPCEALRRSRRTRLTGGATDGDAMSAFVDAIDPLRNAAFRDELPGLHAAFDETVMRRHLQAALLGENGNGTAIGRCERRQAVYDPDQGCVVRYALEVCDRTGRPLGRALASAHLFPSARSSRQHFETRLRPLAAAMRGRPEVAAFLVPSALLEPLSMAVTLFPIDADLPTLVEATEPTVMLEILRGALER